MRKLLKIILISFIGLLLLAMLIPVFYKGKIIDFIKNQINHQIHGELKFGSSGLSLLRSFPNLTLSLYDVQLSGADSFVQVDLFKAQTVRATVNLLRLIKYKQKGIQLNKISLEVPKLNLITLASGLSNLENIYKVKDTNESPDTASSDIQYLLNAIRINNGSFNYSDYSEGMHVSLNHLDHTSSGAYEGSTLTLNHQNTFDSLTYATNDMELLSQVKGSWQGVLEADLDSSIYSLKEDQIKLNELKINLKLYLQLLTDRTWLDVRFNTPENELKQLISLIPGAYQSHFDKIETSGKFGIEGLVVGEYATDGIQPIFNVNAYIREGEIKYAHLPYPIQNIQFIAQAQSIDSLLNRIDIKVPQFSFNLLDDVVEGKLNLTRIGKHNNISGQSKAKLNLNNLNKTLPLDPIQLAGKLDMDIKFAFEDQDVINKNFDRLVLTGNATARGLEISYPPYPKVKAESVQARLDPKAMQLTLLNFYYGKSDAAGTIEILHPLAFVAGHPTFSTVKAKTTSHLLNLDEISDTGEQPCDTCISKTAYTHFLPAIAFESSAEKVIYKDYDLQNIKTIGTYTKDTLKLQSFQGKINQSVLAVNGRLDRPYQWSSDQAELTGWLAIRSDHFLVDPWMTEETTVSNTKTDSTSYLKKLPPHTNLNIYPEIGQVSYGKYLLKNIKGTVLLNQQALEIHDASGNLFNGKIALDGLFNEAGPLPQFNFKLDLNRLGFGEMFNTSPTFAKFAPIAEFIEGVFSSSLVLSGRLNKDQLPIWQELNAAGLIETVAGLLSKFKPLERAAKHIHLPILDLIKWEKSRNWFEIVNGMVMVKPFTIQYQGIPITIGGSHKLDQNMDYDILWQIPRPIFDKYKIGIKTNEGLDWLRDEISKKGLDIGTLDTVFINMNLTGALKNPVVKFNWLADPNSTFEQKLKQQVIDALKDKVDSLKNDAVTKVEAKKDSILADINQKVDEQKQKLDSLKQSAIDTLSAAASDRVQKILDSLARTKMGNVLDSSLNSKLDTILGKKTKEEIDKINDKLKNWNPFKKKPTEGTKQ